jgi:hypothetical protein
MVFGCVLEPERGSLGQFANSMAIYASSANVALLVIAGGDHWTDYIDSEIEAGVQVCRAIEEGRRDFDFEAYKYSSRNDIRFILKLMVAGTQNGMTSRFEKLFYESSEMKVRLEEVRQRKKIEKVDAVRICAFLDEIYRLARGIYLSEEQPRRGGCF